jgi:hypothetical protein
VAHSLIVAPSFRPVFICFGCFKLRFACFQFYNFSISLSVTKRTRVQIIQTNIVGGNRHSGIKPDGPMVRLFVKKVLCMNEGIGFKTALTASQAPRGVGTTRLQHSAATHSGTGEKETLRWTVISNKGHQLLIIDISRPGTQLKHSDKMMANTTMLMNYKTKPWNCFTAPLCFDHSNDLGPCTWTEFILRKTFVDPPRSPTDYKVNCWYLSKNMLYVWHVSDNTDPQSLVFHVVQRVTILLWHKLECCFEHRCSVLLRILRIVIIVVVVSRKFVSDKPCKTGTAQWQYGASHPKNKIQQQLNTTQK